MKITRIYADSDGESHFEDIKIELEKTPNIGSLSKELKATGFFFRETPPDFNYSWHTVPERLCTVTLSGESEIEVSDGEIRSFRSGDVFIAEDTTGRGHISRSVSREPRKTIVITLD